MLEVATIEELAEEGVEDEPGSQGSVDRETYMADMKILGYDIVIPDPQVLLIDIDSEGQYAQHKTMMECYCRNVDENQRPIILSDEPSTSGLPRRHITVLMPFPMTNMERIGYQAVFGSDPWREVLSAVRVVQGDIHPTIFVEKGPP